ncbi:Na+/H+ antiporter subunit E [Deinococcus pimensis]|uniref:Na+/H+ antiporter subunit E n=1 Tax=Deinococcus pimensis TaxID=309888 RepID=UPI001FE055A8|nr:Na+/H+ antiporter subunit E [Deinococcus pimensis]
MTNAVLAGTWALLVGEVSLRTLVAGGLIGFALLAIFRRVREGDGYVRVTLALAGFLAFFARELVVANVAVATLALRPRARLHPVIVAVPLRLTTDVGVTVLAAVITLMPGTVAMGVSRDRRLLYAHAIGIEDADAARASITRVEDHLLRFLK